MILGFQINLLNEIISYKKQKSHSLEWLNLKINLVFISNL